MKKHIEKQNKNQKGIWIDGTKALVIGITNGSEEIREIASDIENRVHHNGEGNKGDFMNGHHINREKTLDERKKHQEHKFIEKVMHEIKDAEEIYIMGPAELKIKLKSRIESDHILSTKLKGVEATDYITLNQCVEKVKRFYAS